MSADRTRDLIEVGDTTIPCGPQAPLLARSALSGWLAGGAEARFSDDACLLVSELVTNSVRHAGRPVGAPLRVTAAAGGGVLRVGVEDEGHGHIRLRPSDPDNGGYGLNLVDQLAARWGVTHEHSTQVWFELQRE